jgi:ribonuclease HI
MGFTLQIVGKPRGEFGEPKERATCNEAEYHALISGLRIALHEGMDEITVRGDSQLVVRQVRGEYKTRESGLEFLCNEAQVLTKRCDGFKTEYNPCV